MTYKGSEIGVPTIVMIDQCIRQKGYRFMAGNVYSFLSRRNWCKKEGTFVCSVEEAVDYYNTKFPTKKPKPLKTHKKIVKAKAKKKALSRPQKKSKEEHPSIPYDKQMKDKRWYAFRKKVFEVKGKRCEKCGSVNKLQVHHPKYKSGRYAWEYDPSRMVVLCRTCHAKEHGIDVRE